ncbi:MAG: putative metal-binding motif-containing protein [Vicinamibacterales bacterium]
MPVEIREDVRIDYTMTITPVAYPGSDTGLAANQGLVVGCLDDHATYGPVASRGSRAADRSCACCSQMSRTIRNATDATTRSADLDCDDFDAADDDCDNLRSAYHPGQTETCDGLDTDCDGRRMEVQECPLANNVCGGTGVSLCTDMGANAVATVCQPDPTCACLSGSNGGCARCIIDTRIGSGGATTRSACAPAIGKLHLDQYCEGGCTVEVVEVEGGEASVASAEIGPFMDRVQSTGYVLSSAQKRAVVASRRRR